MLPLTADADVLHVTFADADITIERVIRRHMITPRRYIIKARYEEAQR